MKALILNQIKLIILLIGIMFATSCIKEKMRSHPLDNAINRINNLTDNTPAYRSLKKEFIREIKSISASKNPEIKSNINYVIVLAARASYLKNSVDYPNVPDINDDYNRMNLGIDVASKITSLKINKEVNNVTEEDIIKYGPTIIYNGRPKHNIDLKKALKQKLITNYSDNKFIILDLPSDQLHTLGQFKIIKKNFDFSNQDIALVTSAFHFSRVGRMFNSKNFDSFGNNVKIYAYLTDRKFQAPGVENELVNEIQKLPIYISQGNLNNSLTKNIIYK